MAAHVHSKQFSFWGLLKYYDILNSGDSCIYYSSAASPSFLKKYKLTHKVFKKLTLHYHNSSGKKKIPPCISSLVICCLYPLPTNTPLIRSVNCRHLTKPLPQNLSRFYFKIKLAVHQYTQTPPVPSIFLRNCNTEVSKNYRFLFPCFARNYLFISQI